MTEVASPDVIDDMEDIHRGLHVAMDHLIGSKDYEEAEVVLRQVDQRMTRLINSVKAIR